MAIWLYLAADEYASAAATYDLAKNGFIWRSYYADRQPPQAIPHVARLAVGDTLYLGYRQPQQIQLLGRFRIGQPDNPLQQSPVFCAAPAWLITQLQQHGYGPDPILGQTVGIFVQEAEPVTSSMTVVPNNRLSIVPISADPTDEPNLPPPTFAPIKGPAVTAVSGMELEQVYMGIDVGGRIEKGFDLCFLTFANTELVNIEFESCPYPYPLPPTAQLRALVADGDFGQLAHRTYAPAIEIAAGLWPRIAKRSPRGAFIDSPSGFSRNRRGHGRATEKVAYRGVWFQCTPSVAVRKEHGGDWSWLVYGMVAYMAFLSSGQKFSEDEWMRALQNGLYSPTRESQALYVRECFPTATVAVLREDRARCARVQQLLLAHQHTEEVKIVQEYLQQGVFAVKRQQPKYDRADALVAALSSLPYVLPEMYQEIERLPRTDIRWLANPGDDILEGRIAVVE